MTTKKICRSGGARKVAVAALTLTCAGLASAMIGDTLPGNGAGFEIDQIGSLYSGDGALSGITAGDDWAQGDSDVGVLDADGNAAPGFNAARMVDANWGNGGDGQDPTQFDGQSNKNDDFIGAGQSPWSWDGGGGGPQKNDITNTYFHSRMDPGNGDLWVFVGAETRSTNGDSHVDFEFNQAGIQVTGTDSGSLVGLGPDGGRTIDDFIISIDFEQGGALPSTSIRVWDGSAFVLMEVPGTTYGSTNLVDIPHGSEGAWKHFASNGAPVEVLSALQLVEGAVNLTAIGVAVDPCSPDATFIAKTRSSSSFTAELKDFALIPFELEPTPECELAGPTTICPGATEVTYTVSETTGRPDITFSWEIVGDATFCDGSTVAEGESVCVNADPVCGGSFELLVTVSTTFCSSDCSLAVDLVDETPPVITCPPDVEFECDDVGDAGTATAEDDCDGAPAISFTDVEIPGDCPAELTIERTWTATDFCGNSSSCVQTITIVDTTPPSITCPDPVTVECIGDVPAPDPGQVMTSDNCSEVVVEHVGDESDGQTCPETITRTYRATDECGNTAECEQVITVDDTTPPEITCPEEVTVECADEVPAPDPGSVGVSDNCSEPGNILVEHVGDASDGQTCPETITRTYRATDECGNTSECQQLITVNDTTPPEITCPGPVTVECSDEVPAPDPSQVSTSDNCAGEVTVEHVGDASDGQTCPETITRTYRATDECGNTSECQQLITVDDTTPPEITCPGPVTVECSDEVPAPDPGLVSASDNCGEVTVEHVGDASDGQTCPETITRTYRATDACGNASECEQLITVDDTTPPEITCPEGVTVECADEVPAPDPGLVSASDNCGAVTVEHVGDASDGQACPETITRTYRATDECGNTAECTQLITVNDTTPPVVTSCPDDALVPCEEPQEFFIAGDDNCDAELDVSCSFTSSSPDDVTLVEAGDGVIIVTIAVDGVSATITCTITDDCGNVATCTFTVTADCPPLVCRFTGGGVIREHPQEGNFYTFGGQAGSPTSFEPTPCGEWTHRQHRGVDGKWTFHAGTASAIPGTYIAFIECTDPGSCSPSGNPPSPVKQLDFGGVGSFRNIRDAGFDAVEHETLHWFDVHIEDLGEPGNQGDADACPPEGHAGGAADCACPDYYRITIRANADPASEIIYEESNYLFGGNFQIHESLDNGPCGAGNHASDCNYGPPRQLNIAFTGDDCSFSSNMQPNDQCTDYQSPMPDTIRVVVSDRSQLGHRNTIIWLEEWMQPGQSFTVDAAAAGEPHVGGHTFVTTFDMDGNLLQSVRLDTSCGQPLYAMDQFGGSVLLSWVGEFEAGAETPDGSQAAQLPADGDVTGDGRVDVEDLLAVVLAWGNCEHAAPECPADLDGNDVVDVADLLQVLLRWEEP